MDSSVKGVHKFHVGNVAIFEKKRRSFIQNRIMYRNIINCCYFFTK